MANLASGPGPLGQAPPPERRSERSRILHDLQMKLLAAIRSYFASSPVPMRTVLIAAGLLSVVVLGLAALAQRAERNGWAFIGTGASILLMLAMIFVKMYGTLGFISADMSNPLNMVTASSSPLTLKLMTWFACFLVPVVLAYQWYASGRKISGATATTYTLTAAEKGKRITVS